MKMWPKKGLAIVGALVASTALILSTALIAIPAVSQIAGLAVAQSSTNWNSVIDASRGDSQAQGILGQSPYLYNGLTFDRVRGDITNGMDVDVTRISGSITPADAYANPTTANQMWSLMGVFNGTTWDRLREATADALTNATGLLAAANIGFNGATWDRIRTASATNNTATTSLGALQTTPLSTWSVIDTDVGATQATATKAAGGGTVRHVATSVTICRGDTAAAAPALVHLRDGATGAGTIIRSWVIAVAAGLSQCENITGLNMSGSANTAMTLEFAAAGAATSTSTVTLTGYSTP